MKKIWKYFVVFAIVNLMKQIECNAQITYEHTYTAAPGVSNNMWLTNLGNNNYKYVVWDFNQAIFSLYNLDHTPLMTNVQVPIVPDSNRFYQIGYITSTLFDCDSTNIEYAVIGKGVSYTGKFMIYRTDGTQLFSRDSVTTLWCVGCAGGSEEFLAIENTPAGTKLFLVTQFPDYTEEMYVYGLCGTLPESAPDINNSSNFVQVFPNPTAREINFNVAVPSHIERQGSYELIIFNSSFQTIKTIPLNSIDNKISVDTEPLAAGEYYYSFQTMKKVFQYGKFIVAK